MGKRAHTSFCSDGGPCWCRAIDTPLDKPYEKRPFKPYKEAADSKPRVTEATLPESKVQEAELPESEIQINSIVRLVEKYHPRGKAQLGERGRVVANMPQGDKVLVWFPNSQVMPDVPRDCLKLVE